MQHFHVILQICIWKTVMTFITLWMLTQQCWGSSAAATLAEAEKHFPSVPKITAAKYTNTNTQIKTQRYKNTIHKYIKTQLNKQRLISKNSLDRKEHFPSSPQIAASKYPTSAMVIWSMRILYNFKIEKNTETHSCVNSQADKSQTLFAWAK